MKKSIKWTLISASLFILFSSILLYALGLSGSFIIWYVFAICISVGIILFIIWLIDRSSKVTTQTDDISNMNKVNVDENEIRREVFEYMFMAESISFRKDDNDIVYSMNEDYFIGIVPIQLSDGTYQQIFGWHFKSKDHGKIYTFRMNVHDYNSKYYEIVDSKINRERFMDFCKEGAKGLHDTPKFTRTQKDNLTGREVVEESPMPFDTQPESNIKINQLSKEEINQIIKDYLKAQ